MPHTTAARRAEHVEVVKGSRFVAVVAPIADEAAAEALLAERRAAHPDASHHCYAFRVGALQRFSDDGEPGGTAGRPILEVLLRRDLDRTAVVVTRWFGGTKLGAGGLVRAYGGSAARALDAAGTRRVLERTRLRLALPFADLDAALRLLDGAPGLTRTDPRFDADGATLDVTLPERDVAALRARLRDATRGAARLDPSDRGPDAADAAEDADDPR